MKILFAILTFTASFTFCQNKAMITLGDIMDDQGITQAQRSRLETVVPDLYIMPPMNLLACAVYADGVFYGQVDSISATNFNILTKSGKLLPAIACFAYVRVVEAFKGQSPLYLKVYGIEKSPDRLTNEPPKERSLVRAGDYAYIFYRNRLTYVQTASGSVEAFRTVPTKDRNNDVELQVKKVTDIIGTK